MWNLPPNLPKQNPRDLVAILKSHMLAHCTDGKTIKRSDQWRLDYLNLPYLIDCSTDEVIERFGDIQANYCTVTKTGQLSPLLENESGFQWISRMTHVMEEFNLRGGIPIGLPAPPHFPTITHPDAPIGAKILIDRPLVPGPFLIKLARKPHSEDLFRKGLIRISPASSWSSSHHSPAVQDDELNFEISISEGEKLNERIGAAEPSGDDGRRAEKRKRMFLKSDDYYAYCMTFGYDYRLLDDFGYDSFVVVYDVGAFTKLLADAVRRARPELRMAAGPVNYCDPFFCATWQLKQGFSKHFRYAYQREWRFVWQMAPPAGHNEAFVVQLGSLEGMASLYTI